LEEKQFIAFFALGKTLRFAAVTLDNSEFTRVTINLWRVDNDKTIVKWSSRRRVLWLISILNAIWNVFAY